VNRCFVLGLALGWSAAFAAGCASYNPHLAATPTPRSTTDLAVTADALLLDRGLGPELFPVPDVSLRRGVGADWDLGGRLFALGGELSARGRVYRAGRYQLALLPLVAGGLVTRTNEDTSFFALSSGAAALNGFRLGERAELTFALRSQLELGLNAVALREDFSAARFRLLAGGSVALDAPIGERWFLSPGIVVLLPYDLDRSELGFPLLQGGLSAHF
jgi:hypothetical protein